MKDKTNKEPFVKKNMVCFCNCGFPLIKNDFRKMESKSNVDEETLKPEGFLFF